MSRHYRSLRERLLAKEKRPLDRTPKPIAPSPPAPLSIQRAHEVSALAVGLLALRHVEDSGRTRLHEQAISDALERVTKHLNAEQMMRLEVEAYEIIDWLVGEDEAHATDTFVAQKQDDGTVHYDPSCAVDDIVRSAVQQDFDLQITYYSSRRMELTERVISPKAIAAEVYVRAWCHKRRDERIFRMSRIRSAVPIHGQAISNPYFEHVLSEQESAQQSLEFEHLAFTLNVDEAAQKPTPTPAPATPTPPVESTRDTPATTTSKDDVAPPTQDAPPDPTPNEPPSAEPPTTDASTTEAPDDPDDQLLLF